MKKVGFIIFLFICILSMAVRTYGESRGANEAQQTAVQVHQTTSTAQERRNQNDSNKKILSDKQAGVNGLNSKNNPVQKTTTNNQGFPMIKILGTVILGILIVGGVLTIFIYKLKPKIKKYIRNLFCDFNSTNYTDKDGTYHNESKPDIVDSGTNSSNEHSDDTKIYQKVIEMINKFDEFIKDYYKHNEKIDEKIEELSKLLSQTFGIYHNQENQKPVQIPKGPATQNNHIFAGKVPNQKSTLKECIELKGTYIIEPDPKDPNKGKLMINQNQGTVKKALSSPSNYIDDICEIIGRKDGQNSIEELQSGVVVKKGKGVWGVETRVKISIK